jgi:F-type H+-transporting ATPase subunit a
MNGLSLLLQAAHAEAAPGPAGAEATAPAHGPAEALLHHVVDQRYASLVVGGIDFGPTRHLAFFVGVALLLTLVVQWCRRLYRGPVPTGPAAFVEILVVYIRDEIAEKNIGHGDGRRFTPLLLSFFFFILLAALFGLLPLSATSTGNISVTAGLAAVSFLAMQYAGISKYGLLGHLKSLVPPGLPLFLLPIMIPVEILGLFTKPFALMVRLFANMLAGHMVITSLLMLIPLLAAVKTVLGVLVIPVSLGLALFIMLLEVLVAFIQAYIFTLLTAIFIGMFAHPAH